MGFQLTYLPAAFVINIQKILCVLNNDVCVRTKHLLTHDVNFQLTHLYKKFIDGMDSFSVVNQSSIITLRI